jgi:flavin reductase (DIM6/NTAB) family NADH-FMN oxidoreductase RutF
MTTSPNPQWKWGQGTSSALTYHSHVEINPFEPGRPMFYNYTFLISSIVPRPIGLVSTVSATGKLNLAPFSYFQVVDHDPPVFIIGFSGRAGRPKDTLQNLKDTGECTFNIVSEDMIEAVNATSIDAPEGVSEWNISGLTKAESTTVKAPRVKESVVSFEGKLSEIVELKTQRKPVGAKGALAIVEVTRFWVQENAIDENRSKIDLDVLRPVGQLGGVSYARVTDTFELPRTNWARSNLDLENLGRKDSAGAGEKGC